MRAAAGLTVGQQIGHIKRGAVAQVGQGITERFEDGDAGVVAVVVGPGVAGQALQGRDGARAQGVVLKLRVGGYGHGSVVARSDRWLRLQCLQTGGQLFDSIDQHRDQAVVGDAQMAVFAHV